MDAPQVTSSPEIRKALFSFSSFRTRFIFWGGAIITGLSAAFFAYMADGAQAIFRDVVNLTSLAPLIVSPTLFALAVWLTIKLCPTASGSGIPQAIAARQIEDPKARRKLLGLHVALGKIFLTALALMGGAAVGREGPTVQVGASLLYMAARMGRMNAQMTRHAILAGAAAGVAAAFNTPLAGIVFAIEEMARAFEYKHSHVVLTAIVFAGAASLSLLGNYSYFGDANGAFDIERDLTAIVVIGVAGGILGSLFARILTGGGAVLHRQLRRFNVKSPVIIAAGCGLAIAVIGLLSGGSTYGSGYEETKALLHGDAAHGWGYTFSKFAATAISSLSGLPGGILSPSLSVGAGLGASLAPYFEGLTLTGAVLLGMTAYFAGVTQAPITTFIIVLEVTGRESMPVPLIATALIATAIGRLMCPTSLYHAMAKSYLTPEEPPPAEKPEAEPLHAEKNSSQGV